MFLFDLATYIAPAEYSHIPTSTSFDDGKPLDKRAQQKPLLLARPASVCFIRQIPSTSGQQRPPQTFRAHASTPGRAFVSSRLYSNYADRIEWRSELSNDCQRTNIAKSTDTLSRYNYVYNIQYVRNASLCKWYLLMVASCHQFIHSAFVFSKLFYCWPSPSLMDSHNL